MILLNIAEIAIVSTLLDEAWFPAERPADPVEASTYDAVVSLFEKIQDFEEMLVKANRMVKQ